MKLNKRYLAIVCLVLAAALMTMAGPAAATPPQSPSAPQPNENVLKVPSTTSAAGDIVPGRVVVKFAPSASYSQQSVAIAGLQVLEQPALVDTSIVAVPEGKEIAMAERLAAMPGVEFAEPEYVYRAHLIPDDTYYAGEQWNLPHINLPAAWDTTTGDSSVVVAVLDTGIDYLHFDLLGQTSPTYPGYDFVNDDVDPRDDRGHGTHVAGIVGAASNNSWGVAGVSWNSLLMSVKVLDNNGDGTSTDVAAGIRWAVDNGADIINMSLGGTGYSAQVDAAVTYAYTSGLTLFASMGNEYLEGNPVEYPAALDNVIAVGAVSNLDAHASYSCTGAHNDIVAPGGDPSSPLDSDPDHWIMSTYWTGSTYDYAQMSGTSQACPHAAGLAALMIAANPLISNDQIEQILKDTAIDLGDAGFDEFFGYGRIDAAAAVAAAQSASTPTPTESPTETPTMTLTATASPTATATIDVTVTPSTTVEITPTPTMTITPTMTVTPTATITPTATVTPTMTVTPTATTTPTVTLTPDSPTATATNDPYGVPTATATPTTGPTSANTLYLPLIFKNLVEVDPTATPTITLTPTISPTPTTTATLAPGDDLIVNGGFEDDEAWIFPATEFTGGYCDTMARSGSRSARLGILAQVDNTESYSPGRQWVTVPSDVTSAQLRFWMYRQSGDAGSASNIALTRAMIERAQPKTLGELHDILASTSGDKQYTIILRSGGYMDQVLLYDDVNVGGWVEGVYDLSEYAGQYIAVHFGVYNDGSGSVSSMHVDDVSLLVATPTP